MLGIGNSLVHSDPIGAPETLLSEDFDSISASTGNSVSRGGLSSPPSNWQISSSGSPSITMYGSTNENSLGTNRGWVFAHTRTLSSATGPGGGVTGGVDTESGEWQASSNQVYMVYESTVPASSTSSTVRHAVRTPELDFSGFSSIELTFWFHAYGSAFGGAANNSGKGVGVACTTNANSCSSAVEAGSGLGFTSDTAGGADIVYTNPATSSVNTVKRLGGTGQVQSTGHTSSLANSNLYVKATVDLSAAAGQSSVYVWWGMFTSAVGNNFRQDLAIDNVLIIGTP